MTKSHSARPSSTKAGHNPELELAREFVTHTNKCIFLTGKAGTGKTTFLKTLKAKPPKRLAVVAPTGVAAINAGGQTIHSLFQLPFGPIVPGNKRDNRQFRRLSRKKARLLRALDLLIIDEISMVRADVLDGIDEVLRRYRTPHQPFGGVQLLMIGDLHQLPPVVKDEEWGLLRSYYNTPFFFSSKALQLTEPVTIQLKHIYRQSDDTFIHLLNKVRNNQIDEAVLETLNSRYQPLDQLPDKDDYITLTTHNYSANTINAEQLSALPGEVHRFAAKISGDFPAHAYPADEALHLKVGAQVMFIKNDNSTDRRYYNGKIGKIISIDEEKGITVQCPGDDSDITVGREEWQNRKYKLNERVKEVEENVVGTFTQYPLRLAWAITIHKSQGLTFERVILDAQAAFAHGQVYVALSRCKTFEGIVLRSRIRSSSVRTDTKVQQFSDEAERNAPDDAELQDAKVAFQQSMLQELFDFRILKKHMQRAQRLLLEYEHKLLPGAVAPFQEVWNFAEQELYPVGQRFQAQLQAFFQEGGMPAENAALQDRTKQAAAWFASQLKASVLEPLKTISVETDNQKTGDTIQEALEQLHEEVFIKLKGLSKTASGFSPADLLRAKTDAMLDFRQQPSAPVTPTVAKLSREKVPHPELLQQLIEWRRSEANAQSLPIFRILPNQALFHIATHLPNTPESLKRSYGIGKKRLEQYGAALLKMVQDYCSRQGVEPSPVFKTPLNTEPVSTGTKTGTKEETLARYRKGMTIEEIARERNLAVSTIEGHIAHFIKQGVLSATSFLKPESIAAIQEKAGEMKELKLSTLHRHFGGAYSYGLLKIALAKPENPVLNPGPKDRKARMKMEAMLEEMLNT
ncbi:helix-turn-helix domain-containing protein [Phaeodactylibacter xiamenensis]|uniref:helix-turn-helix domain-containing protein n=1 Tax=Phaeodactylibacter xiamenensis TaxID=1524460 RepID=UPI003BAC0FED